MHARLPAFECSSQQLDVEDTRDLQGGDHTHTAARMFKEHWNTEKVSALQKG